MQADGTTAAGPKFNAIPKSISFSNMTSHLRSEKRKSESEQSEVCNEKIGKEEEKKKKGKKKESESKCRTDEKILLAFYFLLGEEFCI